jgi:glycerol-3-phosphate dehydrogenase
MPRPDIIIIGAGFTGVATAHDLAQRGFNVTVVERGDIANGTSGAPTGCCTAAGAMSSATRNPPSNASTRT